MKMSDMWAQRQTDVNTTTKVSNLQVMSHFGSSAPPSSRARKKPKSEMGFVVGETKVGGEEIIR